MDFTNGDIGASFEIARSQVNKIADTLYERTSIYLATSLEFVTNSD